MVIIHVLVLTFCAVCTLCAFYLVSLNIFIRYSIQHTNIMTNTNHRMRTKAAFYLSGRLLGNSCSLGLGNVLLV